MAHRLWRTLDIEQAQILLQIPPNADGLTWEHHVLTHRIEGSRWQAFRADWEPVEVNLAGSVYRELEQDSVFPDENLDANGGTGYFLCFDVGETEVELLPALERCRRRAILAPTSANARMPLDARSILA